MNAAKVTALKAELQSVVVELDTADIAAGDIRAALARLSRKLETLEKAIEPEPMRFTPGRVSPTCAKV